MGFLAPAVPWIAKGVGSLALGMLGKKAAKASTQLTPTETLYGGNAAAAGNQLASTGMRLTSSGMDTIAPAQSYFSRILGGSRASLREQMAPEAGQISDTYRGAARSLTRSGLRGADYEQAAADLARDKAGKLSTLPLTIRPQAANTLLNLGTTMTGQGTQATGAAGGLFGQMAGQAGQRAVQGQQIANQTGSDVGRMIFDILTTKGGGSKAKSATT